MPGNIDGRNRKGVAMKNRIVRKKIDISKFRPCAPGLKWYNDFEGSSLDAWNNCPRGDWMLWIAYELNVDERKLVLAKGLCAETVIHFMKDERSRKAVKAAIDYGKGYISKEDLTAAAFAADAAFADYDAAVENENQKKTADICREILTEEIKLKFDVR